MIPLFKSYKYKVLGMTNTTNNVQVEIKPTEVNVQDVDYNAAADQVDERALLIQRANVLGINFAANISTSRLAERIATHLAGTAEEEGVAAADVPQYAERVMTAKELEDLHRRQVIEDQTALVRVVITCMNPALSELESEMFHITNDYMSDRRVIPFGKPWHVSRALYNHLQGLTYQAFRTITTQFGQKKIPFEVPAYGIQVLPPLTNEEISSIATSQHAQGH